MSKTTVKEFDKDGNLVSETVKEVENKVRSRWFMLVLYPDNPVHCEILEHLKCSSSPQGFYIEHEPDEVNAEWAEHKGESKKHWHVMLHYQNARTEKGVRESFGKCLVIDIGDGKKISTYDSTGYDKSQVSVDWVVGKALCSAVSDVHSMSMYFLHKNYESIKLGKKEYSMVDIIPFDNDNEIIQLAYEGERVTSTGSEILHILEIKSELNTNSIAFLCAYLASNHEVDLLRYVEKHSYLVREILRG